VHIEIPFDVKPNNCHNPLSLKKNGLLHTAIPGTEDFDVRQVDTSTLHLYFYKIDEETDDDRGYLLPDQVRYQDICHPNQVFIPEPPMACVDHGPDGYEDLTVKFRMSGVDENVLPDPAPKVDDVLKLVVTGNLLEEFGGKKIVGQDHVVVVS
jgi:hypothetical protein